MRPRWSSASTAGGDADVHAGSRDEPFLPRNTRERFDRIERSGPEPPILPMQRARSSRAFPLEPTHDIVVVGASAGGLGALIEFVQVLPAQLPCAIFVVVHIPSDTPSMLPEILNHRCELQAIHPVDGERIALGKIYVAPPDHHLLVEPDRVRVARGPRHNRHRPAIDPLFRSAARAYGSRVVGVVLSGALDDGSAGLEAIQRRGGVAVVQDPETAAFPGMPQNALQKVDVRYTLAPKEIGRLVTKLAAEPAPKRIATPDRVLDGEVGAVLGEKVDMNRIGKPSQFTCPDCQGTLWEVDDAGTLQFRCRVGHSFTSEGLYSAHRAAVEASLWAAVKSLEEDAELSRRLAERIDRESWTSRKLLHAAEEKDEHARRLRELIESESSEVLNSQRESGRSRRTGS